MKYIVIGLSIYGQVLTEKLTERGHDVVCADYSQSRIEHIKDKCVAAYQLDVTDEIALKSILPIHSVEAVIVTIGDDLGMSVRVVALLKKLGVQHIIARAIDNIHKSILEAFGIDRILTPETDAAYAIVTEMDFGNRISTFSAGPDYRIFKFSPPRALLGLKKGEFNLEKNYHLQLLTIVQGIKSVNSIGSPFIRHRNLLGLDETTHCLTEHDLIVCFGKVNDFQKFYNATK